MRMTACSKKENVWDVALEGSEFEWVITFFSDEPFLELELSPPF
jgi:hypothetical protein